MARPSLAEKDILNPSEAIEYFVLSRRKFGSITKLMGFRIPHIINSAHINEF